MLTLEEAVAKYKAAKTELEDRQRDYWQEPSLPAADRAEKVSHALDAAVRDVARAAVRAMCDEERGLRSISPEAEINRLLGDHPHG